MCTCMYFWYCKDEITITSNLEITTTIRFISRFFCILRFPSLRLLEHNVTVKK